MSRCRLTTVLSLLREKNIQPKRNLSQNFLVDQNIVDKIIDALQLKEDDHVIEIGPGLGALTEKIAQMPVHFRCIEKDQDMVDLLKFEEIHTKSFEIIHKDFMLWQIPKSPKDSLWKVVSNLPYHLTSKILKTLAKNRDKISHGVVMVEKGYAEDLMGMEANKNHDATSFILHYAFEPTILFLVSKNCFFPKPKVDSAILLLKSKPMDALDADFITFIEILFSHKRKTIQSVLKNTFGVATFPNNEKVQKILAQRAETLGSKEAKELFEIFYEQIKKCVEEKEAKTQRYKMGLEE